MCMIPVPSFTTNITIAFIRDDGKKNKIPVILCMEKHFFFYLKFYGAFRLFFTTPPKNPLISDSFILLHLSIFFTDIVLIILITPCTMCTHGWDVIMLNKCGMYAGVCIKQHSEAPEAYTTNHLWTTHNTKESSTIRHGLTARSNKEKENQKKTISGRMAKEENKYVTEENKLKMFYLNFGAQFRISVSTMPLVLMVVERKSVYFDTDSASHGIVWNKNLCADLRVYNSLKRCQIFSSLISRQCA